MEPVVFTYMVVKSHPEVLLALQESEDMKESNMVTWFPSWEAR